MCPSSKTQFKINNEKIEPHNISVQTNKLKKKKNWSIPSITVLALLTITLHKLLLYALTIDFEEWAMQRKGNETDVRETGKVRKIKGDVHSTQWRWYHS